MNTNFFTGAGDGGKVIFGGEKKSKADPVFNVLGLCDEVNVLTGYAALIANEEIKQYVLRIQELLFIAQAEIASIIFGGGTIKIKDEHIKELEEMIVWCDKEIPPIKNFIVPGGSEGSIRMEIARVRTREFERALIGIENNFILSNELKTFANRLSSVFFAFARYENKKKGIEESIPKYK
ncbi:MAG: ATP/cobalamin adenosyltransferase [Parcubacteria group bacterium LiPW_41]|nr:MAG: ATP/cobalamin adenosyltransferase [Parcubacteria group bacterium LiPW_41]